MLVWADKHFALKCIAASTFGLPGQAFYCYQAIVEVGAVKTISPVDNLRRLETAEFERRSDIFDSDRYEYPFFSCLGGLSLHPIRRQRMSRPKHNHTVGLIEFVLNY